MGNTELNGVFVGVNRQQTTDLINRAKQTEEWARNFFDLDTEDGTVDDFHGFKNLA